MIMMRYQTHPILNKEGPLGPTRVYLHNDSEVKRRTKKENEMITNMYLDMQIIQETRIDLA